MYGPEKNKKNPNVWSAWHSPPIDKIKRVRSNVSLNMDN